MARRRIKPKLMTEDDQRRSHRRRDTNAGLRDYPDIDAQTERRHRDGGQDAGCGRQWFQQILRDQAV
jgi:hypothetical protein